ncbi:MAG: transposase [Melioribacteraceae bacterium]|nr:transposase [Melioribacteraceae bacterium]MCF8356857.1 transposase [Melioribacteraceae bacterium]MCF8396236.1 transposase [Melioribacteraceae bacterium]MCF8421158.1 transposase [Melioribacteraceae bacterium]
MKNDNGEIELTVPREHNGEFDPVIVKKYEKTARTLSQIIPAVERFA